MRQFAVTQPMETTPRQPHLLLLLAASFVIYSAGFVVDQIFRWSNPLAGAANGLFTAVFMGIAWLIVILPINLLTYGLYRWRGWQRLRTFVILLPAIAAFSMPVADLSTEPPTAANRFRKFTNVELPSTVHDIRTHFTGGFLADYGDTYYFRCSPAETDRLINALDLHLTDAGDQQFLEKAPFPSWPDPSKWVGSTLYKGERDERTWFYYLRTDSTREQVYLLIFCL